MQIFHTFNVSKVLEKSIKRGWIPELMSSVGLN